MTKIGTIFWKCNLLSLACLLWAGVSFCRAQEFPVVDGNSLWCTRSGEEYIDRLLEDIASAQKSIEIEYYWFAADNTGTRVRDALMAKAREGVAVRVVMDNLISPLAPVSFYDKLRAAGATVLFVHDFKKMNAWDAITSFLRERDHRKIVVIDCEIAYTGGINFYDNAVYKWEDAQIRLQGPIAAQLRSQFMEAWELAGGENLEPSAEIAPCGTVSARAVGKQKEPPLDGVFVEAIEAANEYFYLQTPYFAPPESILQALKDCAARGVDVRLLIPLKSDWEFMNELTRDYLPELSEAGVHILVKDSKYDHGKVFISDDRIASCGTINMDYRSLVTNWENTVLFYDTGSVLLFKNTFLELSSSATEQHGADFVLHRGPRKLWRRFLRKNVSQF